MTRYFAQSVIVNPLPSRNNDLGGVGDGTRGCLHRRRSLSGAPVDGQICEAPRDVLICQISTFSIVLAS